MPVDPGGVVLGTDDDGAIVPVAAMSAVPKRWIEPVEAAISECRTEFGSSIDSIYLRGGLPLGTARPGRSDIDIVVLTTRSVDVDSAWPRSVMARISGRWPFVAGVDLVNVDISSGVLDRRVAATIATQSACADGIHIAPRLPRFRPGPDLVIHGWWLPRDLARATVSLTKCADESMAQLGNWAMKRLVRAGFEVVMERDGCYTRDLVPAYEHFAAWYPMEAPAMRVALSLAIDPRPAANDVVASIEEIGSWVCEELCVQYGADRISQVICSDVVAIGDPSSGANCTVP